MKEVRPEHPIANGDTAEIRAMVLRQLDAHSNIRERVASLEEAARHFATKADVSNAKVWALSSVGALLLAVVCFLIKLSFFP